MVTVELAGKVKTKTKSTFVKTNVKKSECTYKSICIDRILALECI